MTAAAPGGTGARRPGFRPAPFFVLRAPLLPFGELEAWAEGLAAPGAAGDPARLEAALAHDRALLRGRLRSLVERPEVREAVFVASPDLEESLDAWLRDPSGERGEKVELALVRYLERMAGRATPFGLFAGCAVGEIGERTVLSTAPLAERGRHTRLDMDYLCGLVDALAADPELRPSLRHFPNTSIYRAAGRLRYVESRLDKGIRSHHLVAVDASEYLDAALERARDGARPAEVVDAILELDPEIEREDAAAFVEELIGSQLLVSELEPPVTGGEALDATLERLRAHPAAAEAVARLEEVRARLRDLDASPPAADSPRRYREVAEALGALPARVELPRLLQVDMTRPGAGATLGAGVLAELTRGVELLHRVTPPNWDDRLVAFRTAFQARFEGREVPLVEALDEEIGIGFEASSAPGAEGSPLLHGLDFAGAEPRKVSWNRRESHLLRMLEDARGRGAREVELGPEDVEALSSTDPAPLPDAFSLRAVVGAASQEALDAGDFRVELDGAGGPSGARVLGRFCHADPALRERVEAHLRAEEALRPDAVFAEVVHLPEGRIGNILFRPVLRGWEIPYLGRSGAPAERRIPVTDLRVSLAGDRIVLRSASLGKQVVPRLTSAHNFSRRSVGMYRFLCSLQTQGVAGGVAWSWGVLERARFLPRVVSGRLVLSRARWRLEEGDIRGLRDARGAARFARAQALRGELELPRWITLADGDNELPVDLDNVLSVEAFVHAVRGRSDAVLMEMFPAPEELAAHGPEGRFVSELVVACERAAEPAPAPRSAPAVLRPVARSFAPGSEWLYAKLYTGTATADVLLREVVRPLAAEALASGAAHGWFFIRYGDPEWHLRVRLRGDPARLLSETVPRLHELASPLLADGSLWRVQLDTYERETERYGGPEGIEPAERLFHADSEAVLAVLDTLSGDEGADLRWRVALCGVDTLLADLGLDAAAKHAVMRAMEASMAREFNKAATLKRELSDRFRRDRASLESLLAAAREGGDGDLPPGLVALRRRSEALRPVAAELAERERAGRLNAPVQALASSFTHMHLNRILRSSARAQEMVIYHLLGRLYESEAARRRSG